MKNDKSDRPLQGVRIIVISYFFYPSREVGAKRVSELALSLEAAGANIRIIHARSSSLIPTDPALLEPVAELQRYPVTVPPKIVDKLWKWLKTLRGGSSGSSEATGTKLKPTLDQPNAQRPKNLGVVGFLRRQYLAADSVFGGRKFWLFLVALRILALRVSGRCDLVISSGPPMVGYLGGRFARTINQALWVMDMRDPWFLNRLAGRVTEGHWMLNWEDRTIRRCIEYSDAIVAASPGIVRYIEQHFTKRTENITVVRNGYDPAAVIYKKPPMGKLAMLYCGTLYLNRNPFPLLEALDSAVRNSGVDRNSVQFLMVGECDSWNGIEIKDWVRQRSMQDLVKIRSSVPYAELRALVESSNLLVNFAQGQVYQIPAKTYEYIAAGREFLVLAEATSDSAILSRELALGHVIEPENVDDMQDFLREAIDRHVFGKDSFTRLEVTHDVYSRANQNAKYVDYLAGILKSD